MVGTETWGMPNARRSQVSRSERPFGHPYIPLVAFCRTSGNDHYGAVDAVSGPLLVLFMLIYTSLTALETSIIPIISKWGSM